MYRPVKTIPIPNIADMHTSPNKQWLACNTSDKKVEIIQRVSGDFLPYKTLTMPSTTAQGKNGIRFSLDGNYLAVTDQQWLVLFSVPDFEEISRILIGSDISADFTRGHGLCFHPNKKVIAVTGKSWIGTFTYFGDTLVNTGVTTGHAGFYTPTFSPDGSVLAVECSANHAVLFKFNESSDGLSSLPSVAITNPIDNLFIDNRIFVSSGTDNKSVVLTTGDNGATWVIGQELTLKACTTIRFDGKRIAVSTASGVEVLDQWSLSRIETIPAPAGAVMTFI